MTSPIRKRKTATTIKGEILNESNSLLKEFTKNLPPPSSNRSLVWDIVCSIFEPGINTGLMAAIHFSFLSLAAVHFWLIWLTGGKDWTIWGLVALNFILYPSLITFIHFAYKNKTTNKK